MNLSRTVVIVGLASLVGLGLIGSQARAQASEPHRSSPWVSQPDQEETLPAREILAQAWSLFNQGDLRRAERLFRQAHSAAHREVALEAGLGLGYTLVKLNDPQAEAVFETLVAQGYALSQTVPALIRIKKGQGAFDQAMALTERLTEPQGSSMQAEILRARLNASPQGSQAFVTAAEELLSLEPDDRELRLQLAWACFELGRYACAQEHFARLDSQWPPDPEVLQGLGWSLFKQGSHARAAEAFARALHLQPSPKRAEDLLLALEKAGDHGSISDRLRTWRTSQDPELRAVAARRYEARKLPVLTDQTSPGQETCFSGCSRPWLETGLYFSHREAEDGFSGLDQTRIPISIHGTQEFGRVWSLSLTPLQLDAGEAGRAPFAGSYFRYLETDRIENSLEDELWGLEPRAGLLIEGRPTLAFELGLTPLEGPIDPRPTFSLEASVPDSWSLRLHQCSVQDSFLSYVGQQDPYSDRTWGRVLKTGLEGSRTVPLGGDAWVSLDFGAHLYWGQNVVDNTSLSGTVSLGQTRTLKQGDLNAGLFATARHFERNTDFMTFGHGGYFSPEVFWMVGPFVRWTSRLCQGSWLDVQVGGGYFDYSTEKADFYPENDQDVADLGRQSARDNLTGEYGAGGDDGLGVNAAVQAWHRVGDHLALGGFGRVNTTSKYEEWQAGIALRVTMSPRAQLCPPLDLIKGSSSCQ